MTHRSSLIPVVLAGLFLMSACTPTVKVEAPDKPITINLNVNISHEIRVKIDKDLDNLIENKQSLF